jgi:hypothetical protein
MERVQELLDVATGNRSLSIAIDTMSIVLLVFGFFVAMLLALFIAGFIIT